MNLSTLLAKHRTAPAVESPDLAVALLAELQSLKRTPSGRGAKFRFDVPGTPFVVRFDPKGGKVWMARRPWFRRERGTSVEIENRGSSHWWTGKTQRLAPGEAERLVEKIMRVIDAGRVERFRILFAEEAGGGGTDARISLDGIHGFDKWWLLFNEPGGGVGLDVREKVAGHIRLLSDPEINAGFTNLDDLQDYLRGLGYRRMAGAVDHVDSESTRLDTEAGAYGSKAQLASGFALT